MKKKFSYQGNELDIFKNATNWKSYWIDSIKDYIYGDVLEVGAGIGINTRIINDNISSINKYVAIEPDLKLYNESKKIILNKNNGVTQLNCYLNDLDKEIKFDTILYIDVIEHIEQDYNELKNSLTYLKKNGHLVVLVPAFNSAYSEFDQKIGHFRRYTKKTLSKIVSEKLVNEKLIYLDSIGLTMSYFNKHFLKQDEPKLSQILFWDKVIIPISKIVDMIIRYWFGKSLIGVWKK